MRRLKFWTVLGFAAFGLMGLQVAQAQDSTPEQTYKLGTIEIDNAWARPSTGKTAAAYLTLTNHGTGDDALISVASNAAAKVQVHETVMDGNIMRMHKLDTLPLPAGQTVKVAPGGVHIMLIDLAAPLVEGGSFALHLEFAKAGQIDVAVPVQMKESGASAAAHDHMMSDHMMSDHMTPGHMTPDHMQDHMPDMQHAH